MDTEAGNHSRFVLQTHGGQMEAENPCVGYVKTTFLFQNIGLYFSQIYTYKYSRYVTLCNIYPLIGVKYHRRSMVFNGLNRKGLQQLMKINIKNGVEINSNNNSLLLFTWLK